MFDSVRLSLHLGYGPAVPAPLPVIEALQSAEINVSTQGPSAFQLVFALRSGSPLESYFLVAGNTLPSAIRVILVAHLSAVPDVLIDGVVTHHQLTPGGGGVAQLSVTGEDLTCLMNRVAKDGTPFPAMQPAARVLMLLGQYAMYGVAPIVVSAFLEDVPIPTRFVPRQFGTDFEYICQLANEAGYEFYLDPGPLPGVSKAYWGPAVKLGEVQPALNVNMDAATNAEALSFRFDSEQREMPVVYIQEPFTKTTIPVPIPTSIPSLLNPKLGLIEPGVRRFRPIPSTSKMSPTEALMTGLAAASRSSDAIRASGTLDVARYGRVLKARKLVGIRGAGRAFDGLYYVESVTHRIRRGEYKQSFELSRNGLVSTLPRVPA